MQIEMQLKLPSCLSPPIGTSGALLMLSSLWISKRNIPCRVQISSMSTWKG
nr:hypothetical protein Q903MT_gene1418 [Picea sitchensis]